MNELEKARAELAKAFGGGSSASSSDRAFLLDISDSMHGNKLEEAKKALLKHAKPNEDLIIVFGRDVAVLQYHMISAILTKGDTAMLPAIMEAVYYNVSHIVLITDGGANTGGGPFECIEYVSQLKGVKIDTIGIGRDCDDELLQQLSYLTGGNTYHVNDPFQLSGIVGLLSAPQKAINL